MLRARSVERGDESERWIDPGADDDDLLTPESFEAFVVRHHREVNRFATRVVGPAAADDVVSETFAAAWSSWSSAPRSRGARRAWAFGIAHHRSVDHLRAVTRRRSLVDRLASRSPTTTEPGPDTGMLTQAGVEALTQVLTPSERDALLLTVIGGLTCAEAATVLGCSETAVTTRLSRARRRLRETLTIASGGSET